MSDALDAAQSLLFQQLGATDTEPRVIHVLGSPRTGSTLFYQLLIQGLEVSYFSNLIADHFPRHPVVGAAIEQALGLQAPASTTSRYGKTEGVEGPSEASSLFMHWFGGGHPSQVVSSRILDAAREQHLASTFRSMETLRSRPVLTKNAWNCFRIEEIVRLLPESYFLWIQRDLYRAARSDLRSRYRHGGPESWNSASPSNYEEIRARPYWEQVIEQQYEYNRTLGDDLGRYAPQRHLHVWYEDLCDRPEATLDAVHSALAEAGIDVERRIHETPQLESTTLGSPDDDDRRMLEYVEAHAERLAPYLRETAR